MFHVSRLTSHASLILALLLSVFPAFASDLDDGMALFVSGDYQQAKEKFAAHLSTHPDDPTALYHLGMVEKDALKSKYYFERLIETHPEYPGADAALFEIAQFYYISPFNLSGTAREEFQRLLRDYPRSPFVPRAHYHIGLTHASEGAHGLAREAFRRAIQTDPAFEVAPFARAAIAESYLLEGRPDLAIQEAEDAWPQKRMEPVAGRLLAVAAEAWAQKGNGARADSLRTLLVQRFPDSDDATRIAPPPPAVPTSAPSPPAVQRPDTTQREPLTRSQPDRPPGPRYLVQVGMFGHTAKARALLSRLRVAGFKVHDETRKVRGRNLWIFTSGPYDDPEEARRIAERIDRQEHLGCRVAEVK